MSSSIRVHPRYIKSGSIGIINITEIRRRQCRLPTAINGRDTAVPSPLYHSGAAGIDIIPVQPETILIRLYLR